MLIIPIGHERGTVLRWPWVTLSIVALCVLAYLAAYPFGVVGRNLEEQNRKYQEAVEYFWERPYLKPDPALEVSGGRYSEREMEMLSEAMGEIALDSESESVFLRREEQKTLDQLTRAWLESREADPRRGWGLVPQNPTALGFLTYMFIHAGFLHLLGNLIILYLAGPAIEDVWGRPVFLAFYLLAGIFAAALFTVHYPTLEIPLIGASGAISGVMGAFLVRYWNIRIRFFYFIWVIFKVYTGTFRAAAWVMLPLWLLNELFNAYVSDSMHPDGGGSVAHWAHIWGFVFGVGVALAFKQLKLEDRLQGSIHGKIGLVENQALERALRARENFRFQEAWDILTEELAANPGNEDAAVALWDVGVARKQPEEALPAMLRLIRTELRSGNRELGLRHWDEVQVRLEDAAERLEPPLRLLLVEAMLKEGDEAGLKTLLPMLHGDLNKLQPLLLLRLGRCVKERDPKLAAEGLEMALQHRDLTDELRREIRAELDLAQALVTQAKLGTAEMQPAAPVAEERRLGPAGEPPAFVVLGGTPRVLRADRLSLELNGKGKVGLPFAKMQGIGAARIQEASYQPYYLLDLFLDPPLAGNAELRVVRCLSSLYDPVSLVPMQPTPDAAFYEMLSWLKAGTGKRVIPPPPAMESGVATFESVEDYEQAVRRTLRAAEEGSLDSTGGFLVDLPELPGPL